MGSPAVDMIEGLKRLPHDWDSYGADAPDERTVARALSYLGGVISALGPAYGQPEIQPIPDPGVSMTWRSRWHPEEVEVLGTPAGAEWALLSGHRGLGPGVRPHPARVHVGAHTTHAPL